MLLGVCLAGAAGLAWERAFTITLPSIASGSGILRYRIHLSLSDNGASSYPVRISFDGPDTMRASGSLQDATPIANAPQENEGPVSTALLETQVRDDQTFETARRQAPAGLSATARRKSRMIGDVEVLAVSFDLAGDAASGSTVEVSKPIVVNGKGAGEAVIQIKGEKGIYLRSDTVLQLLAGMPPSRSSKTVEVLSSRDPFVSWARLRESGMNLRYDPLRDRIIVETRSS